jgi:replicative DNA helicase
MEYKHISESVDKFIGLVDGRRKGLVKSLRVGSPKVNNVLMNGFEWNRIVTVCGRSSSGKSLWVEQIKREFCDLNGSQSFDILSFEFEMLATDQIARNVSGKTGYSTKYIYSAEKNKVTEDEINTISYEANKLKTYPIYYVDETGTPDEIYYTVLNFVEEKGLRESKKGLVLTIDHVLLTKGKEGESEKHIIDTLCKKMIQLKKYFEANDMKIIIIMVSQLNRDIETGERVLNNKLHYPTRS